MSVQFGKCNFDRKPVDPEDLDEVRPVLAPYGPDGEGYICKDNFGLLYRALHTSKESRHEDQPYVSASGSVLAWDGRLDNRQELIGLLGRETSGSTDLKIVAAAYEHWGSGSFAKLIGDWAIAIWEPKHQSLILAKDFVGTRQLYFSVEKGQVSWCTVLDPLVLLARHSFKLEEEYIAGWLSFFPAPHLTPYVGIHSVPACCFVRITAAGRTTTRYWDFDPSRRIVYREDSEYEEHFRIVFRQSVRRRLRSDSPVLAELSGGVDSSSIVCVADEIIAQRLADIPKLETISYFNDQEPNWNERPYFTRVEQKRGRAGWHIDIAEQASTGFRFQADSFASMPSAIRPSDPMENEFAKCIGSSGSCVLLSGIGGDEVSGGIPVPTPELADLLATIQFRRLAHQLKAWALEKRNPWFHLLFDAAKGFLPPMRVPTHRRPAPWLQASFKKRHWKTLTGYEPRLKLSGSLPSFQDNLTTLDSLRRQLGCMALPSGPAYEKRYPYLDRDFLEFLYAIPRTQLVRPGQRRSLMRRALRDVVPAEILDRRRKAFITRAPFEMILSDPRSLSEMTRGMVSGFLGVVAPAMLSEIGTRAAQGHEIHIVSFLRTIFLEVWLRNLNGRGILAGCSNHADDSGTLFPMLEFARDTTVERRY
jgi:asparagine synthase (glutamine-hydrolysing)